MHILVTGGSGFVGWDLVRRTARRGHDVTYTYHETPPPESVDGASRCELDVRRRRPFVDLVERTRPDAVVHAAAVTDADACERNEALATAVNVEGTRNAVRACERVGAHLLYVSTSFVFDMDETPLSEDAARSPVNHYGETKARAEDVVASATVPTTTCRIDQPYDWLPPWRGETFVTWVLEQCRSGDPFPVFTDWHNTPVYVPDCNEVFLELLSDRTTGTYHVVGDDYVSRYEWARIVADVFGYDPDLVERGHSDDVALPATRPSNHLENDSVVKTTEYEFASLRGGLREMRRSRRTDDPSHR